MEKALEILKDCSKEGFLRYTRYELDEAIAELEEAMKPKTSVLEECLCCGGCKHYNGKEEETCQIVSGWHEENFYCNKFEV